MSTVINEPRTEQLSAEIAALRVRITELEGRRHAESRLAGVARAPIEVGLARLRRQLEPLEAELAKIVAEQDARTAAKRAEAEAEAQRQRAAAEKELPKVEKARLEAMIAVEDATATLAAVVADALEADRQLLTVKGVLEPGRNYGSAASPIGAHIHTRIREAGVKMDDFYSGGPQHHVLVDPAERPQPAQVGRPCSVCSSSDRAAIEAAIAAGDRSVREVASTFDVGKDALHRHLANHQEA